MISNPDRFCKTFFQKGYFQARLFAVIRFQIPSQMIILGIHERISENTWMQVVTEEQVEEFGWVCHNKQLDGSSLRSHDNIPPAIKACELSTFSRVNPVDFGRLSRLIPGLSYSLEVAVPQGLPTVRKSW